MPASRMSTSAASAVGQPAAAQHNLLANGAFDDGVSLPWTSSFTAPAEGEAAVRDKALCLDVRAVGKNRWDAQLRHREMVIQKGHHYVVRFRAWSDRPTRVRPKVGMAGPPYAEYWADTIELGPAPRWFDAEFDMDKADDPTAEFAFHAGAELASSGPFRMCIDDVELTDPQFARAAAAADDGGPRLLVNQLGYLPNMAKLATLKTQAQAPLRWQLEDAQGAVVAEGTTIVHGADAASGDRVHVIDFSSFTTQANGYRLSADGAESHPFSIAAALYGRARYDALAFFYHQRSGVDITLPYALDARWTRPAGHKSDRSVPCASGCSYSLDVSGGWYDAGDHGKYVVNGGIAVWTLLDQYERAAQLHKGLDKVGDKSMAIPEAGNGVPDLLDEARFELEFLLKMQVPEGKPLAGMVHHKIHDKNWTELGTAPHEDMQPRFLYPPSTAATLNLAATAAQASRLFRPFDAAFSARCLAAAKRAWTAASAHPDVFAGPGNVGGGPYDDTDVRDEFYWAAAELLATTGEPAYAQFVESSPMRNAVPVPAGTDAARDPKQHGAFTWQEVETAGTISLALSSLPALAGLREQARAAIVAAGDALLAARDREGYRVPLAAGSDGYPWGSNSLVLNDGLVLALAADFSGEAKYRDAAASALDYIFGRNPLDQSYVTGYGARPLQHPHHRFWAQQARADRPPPPPGIVSGGPNSALQDPYAQSAGLAGKPPQKCFIDHIESWSTNEITINWNAPLAWLLAYLDDEAR
jgi:endoglucanase